MQVRYQAAPRPDLGNLVMVLTNYVQQSARLRKVTPCTIMRPSMKPKALILLLFLFATPGGFAAGTLVELTPPLEPSIEEKIDRFFYDYADEDPYAPEKYVPSPRYAPWAIDPSRYHFRPHSPKSIELENFKLLLLKEGLRYEQDLRSYAKQEFVDYSALVFHSNLLYLVWLERKWRNTCLWGYRAPRFQNPGSSCGDIQSSLNQKLRSLDRTEAFLSSLQSTAFDDFYAVRFNHQSKPDTPLQKGFARGINELNDDPISEAIWKWVNGGKKEITLTPFEAKYEFRNASDDSKSSSRNFSASRNRGGGGPPLEDVRTWFRNLQSVPSPKAIERFLEGGSFKVEIQEGSAFSRLSMNIRRVRYEGVDLTRSVPISLGYQEIQFGGKRILQSWLITDDCPALIETANFKTTRTLFPSGFDGTQKLFRQLIPFNHLIVRAALSDLEKVSAAQKGIPRAFAEVVVSVLKDPKVDLQDVVKNIDVASKETGNEAVVQEGRFLSEWVMNVREIDHPEKQLAIFPLRPSGELLTRSIYLHAYKTHADIFGPDHENLLPRLELGEFNLLSALRKQARHQFDDLIAALTNEGFKQADLGHSVPGMIQFMDRAEIAYPSRAVESMALPEHAHLNELITRTQHLSSEERSRVRLYCWKKGKDERPYEYVVILSQPLRIVTGFFNEATHTAELATFSRVTGTQYSRFRVDETKALGRYLRKQKVPSFSDLPKERADQYIQQASIYALDKLVENFIERIPLVSIDWDDDPEDFDDALIHVFIPGEVNIYRDPKMNSLYWRRMRFDLTTIEKIPGLKSLAEYHTREEIEKSPELIALDADRLLQIGADRYGATEIAKFVVRTLGAEEVHYMETMLESLTEDHFSEVKGIGKVPPFGPFIYSHFYIPSAGKDSEGNVRIVGIFDYDARGANLQKGDALFRVHIVEWVAVREGDKLIIERQRLVYSEPNRPPSEPHDNVVIQMPLDNILH